MLQNKFRSVTFSDLKRVNIAGFGLQGKCVYVNGAGLMLQGKFCRVNVKV